MMHWALLLDIGTDNAINYATRIRDKILGKSAASPAKRRSELGKTDEGTHIEEVVITWEWCRQLHLDEMFLKRQSS